MAENNPSAARTEPSLASGLQVVEIGESISAALAGMVLADYGADVLVVEPPNGSRLRPCPAFAMWSRGKQQRAHRPDDASRARTACTSSPLTRT